MRTQRTPRTAARLVVVSPQDTVFLFRDHNRETGLHWLPPGGGIDPGETPEQAVLRELREETGWTDLAPERLLCTWEHDFTHQGVPTRQYEHIYVTSGPLRDPVPESPDAHWRWWDLDALAATRDPLWPPTLPALLRAPSREPVHLGLIPSPTA
ncbi:NUDIX hydrolase [Streptomyces sp. 12297]